MPPGFWCWIAAGSWSRVPTPSYWDAEGYYFRLYTTGFSTSEDEPDYAEEPVSIAAIG